MSCQGARRGCGAADRVRKSRDAPLNSLSSFDTRQTGTRQCDKATARQRHLRTRFPTPVSDSRGRRHFTLKSQTAKHLTQTDLPQLRYRWLPTQTQQCLTGPRPTRHGLPPASVLNRGLPGRTRAGDVTAALVTFRRQIASLCLAEADPPPRICWDATSTRTDGLLCTVFCTESEITRCQQNDPRIQEHSIHHAALARARSRDWAGQTPGSRMGWLPVCPWPKHNPRWSRQAEP